MLHSYVGARIAAHGQSTRVSEMRIEGKKEIRKEKEEKREKELDMLAARKVG